MSAEVKSVAGLLHLYLDMLSCLIITMTRLVESSGLQMHLMGTKLYDISVKMLLYKKTDKVTERTMLLASTLLLDTALVALSPA